MDSPYVAHSESQTDLSEKKRHKKNLYGFDLLKGDVKNFEFFKNTVRFEIRDFEKKFRNTNKMSF